VIAVTLTWEELEYAMDVAVHRAIVAKQDGRRDRYGCAPAQWAHTHVESYPPELAVAKWTGLEWHGPDPYDPDLADVGDDIEVRSTTRRDGCLITHPADKDDRRFYLVIPKGPEDPRTFHIVGWRWGRETKVPRYWRTNTGRPAYFTPQADLHPVGALV
jgi:hypothetical protein